MKPAISAARFEAALFDLDGVLTPTATVHAACWKRVFDNFLEQHAQKMTVPFKPFDIKQDYNLYVDGKPRYPGVESFLASRNIQLPYGDPNAPPNQDTVCGLGNSKDSYFIDTLHEKGIEAYAGALALVQQLRSQGLKTAVVSSSRNCKEVLKVAKITELFDTIMDGKLAEALSLPGKPAPDTFLNAAETLGCLPQRAVVLEDAIAGVQAGRDGNFGLVIGVAHQGNAQALLSNGAHKVVNDLSELL